MQISQYEDIAQSFLDDHPVGTVVSASAVLAWIEQHSDGAAIKPDLAIVDPSKRISAVRRHLNQGGRSDANGQDRRFQLEVEDAKHRTFIIRPHAEVVQSQATGAISKSINGALNPLKLGRQAIDAVKLDELPDIERKALEMARENITAMEAAVKPTLAQEVDRIWVGEMMRRGISAEHARIIRDALPQVTHLQKLLKTVTS